PAEAPVRGGEGGDDAHPHVARGDGGRARPPYLAAGARREPAVRAVTMAPAADLTLRTAFALLFAVAASHKVRDPARFRATLADYRLLPAPFVWPAAMLTIGAELAVAVVLFVSSWRALGPLTAAALLCVYAVAMAINLARGRRHLDCGCAGPAHRQPISGGLVVRNALLA